MSVRIPITLVVTLCMWGCGSKTDEDRRASALETALGGKAQIERRGSNEIVTIEDRGTRTTIARGAALTAPASYPTDGFIPDGAVLKTSVSQGGSITIVYVIPGPLVDAVHRSQSTLRGRGWLEESELELHSGSAFAAYRKGAANLSEQFVSQPNGTIEVTQMYISGG